MAHVFKVGAYVKLAKLWERRKNDAIAYHNAYYEEKYAHVRNMQLVDVYIDITGSKEIRNRPAMLRLMRDCRAGKVNCIVAQTSGYLAANTREFSYLLKYLFDLDTWIELVTEDKNYHIDTITNMEDQREALQKMADSFARLEPAKYEKWKSKAEAQMALLTEE